MTTSATNATGNGEAKAARGASMLANFSVLTTNNLLSPLASAALVLVISRVQGVEALGRYSIAMAFFGLAQSCVSLGLPIVVTRGVAQQRERAAAYFVSGCLVSLLLLVPILAVLLPFEASSAQTSDMRSALVVLCVALVPSVVTAYGEAILLAIERPQDFVVIGLAENLCRTAIGALLVGLGHGIAPLALAILGLRIAAAAASLVALRRRRVPLVARLDPALVRELVRQVPVVASIPLVTAIYWRSDILILTWFGGLAAVGYYSAAIRLLDVARAIPQSLGRASYPVLSRLHVDAPAEFRALCRQLVRGSVLLMTSVAVLTWAIGGSLVATMYGLGFEPAAAVLRIVGWSMVPFALTVVLAHVLFAAHRQAADLGVNVVATVFSVVVNCVVVPRWGATGAAWTAVLSMFVHAALQYAIVQRMVQVDCEGWVARAAVAAAIAVVAVEVIAPPAAAVRGAVALVVFASGCGALRVATRDDADLLLAAVRRTGPAWGMAER